MPRTRWLILVVAASFLALAAVMYDPGYRECRDIAYRGMSMRYPDTVTECHYTSASALIAGLALVFGVALALLLARLAKTS